MRAPKGHCLVFCVLLPLVGCAGGERQLRSRAAFELGCQETARITEIDSHTRGVEACGRRQTYVQRCDKDRDGDERCEWIRPGPVGVARVTVTMDDDVKEALAQALSSNGGGGGGDSSDSDSSGSSDSDSSDEE